MVDVALNTRPGTATLRDSVKTAPFFFLASTLVSVAAATLPRCASAVDEAALNVGVAERLFLIAPHPDDETLGAGGLVQRVLERGGTVDIVLVTAGDGYVEAVVRETGLPRPRPAQYVAYGERRLHETRLALRQLGRQRMHLDFLGFPDGGLEGLLQAHWQRTHPERSRTTRASDAPYAEALEPDVPYDGADLRRELVRLLKEDTPTIVVLPDPLDRHPDHRAAGLFALIAIQDWLGKTAGAGAPRRALPQLLAYLVHWPDWPPGWNVAPPRPGGGPLALPSNLPPRGLTSAALTLTDAEIAAKAAALARYKSQQEVMAPLMAAFVTRTEPFTVYSWAEAAQVGRLIEAQGRKK
jgi:LmbE family N-acetylglucosaminyl deacetylase